MNYPNVEVMVNTETASGMIDNLKNHRCNFVIGALNMLAGLSGFAIQNVIDRNKHVTFIAMSL